MKQSWWKDFFDSLNYLIEGELPIEKALAILEENERTPHRARVIGELRQSLIDGDTLSQTLENLKNGPELLAPLLVKAGEDTGNLKKSLSYLSFYLGKKNENTQKIVSSMIYPAFIVVILIVSSIGMSIFALPRIETLFISLNQSSNIEVMLQNSRMTQNIIIFFLLFICFITSIFYFYMKRNNNSCNHFDIFLYSITPSVFLDNEFFTFFSILEVLCGGGIMIDTAIQSSWKVLKNRVLIYKTKELVRELRDGHPFSSLLAIDVFPPQVVRWVSYSENIGDSSNVFTHLREYYEKKIERNSQIIAKWIEPIFIVITGLIMILFIFIFVLPLISLMGEIV
jgi:type II secretory pathway component PulF